jgi:capsular polysaccharide biosynthesis protein
MLKDTYGDHFRVFRAQQRGIEQAIELFERARLVIGSRGGALYHALWASRTAKVVELIPVGRNGEYAGQG